MSTDTSLITFKAISNFTNDLEEVFGELHRPLKLYAHLINKTTISHDKPIRKHIDAFRDFCISNRDAIFNKEIGDITKNKISYSNRVFIDIKQIFKHSDPDTNNIIWKHLLTISALVDPAGQARKILKEQSDSSGTEIDFLSNIISRVEDKVDPNSNPMEAISSIMQSGIFTDLVNGMGSGLQDGSLDLSKLLGTVQTMVTKLSDDENDTESGKQAMNMISNLMGNISSGLNTQSNNGQTDIPDFASMLGPMMGAMMGAGNGGIPDLSGIMNSSGISIEEQINNQVESLKDSGNLSENNDTK